MPDRLEYARLIQPLLGQAAGYARSILRERSRAQDAVQQAALRGLERLHTFDPSRPFKAWWFAILRNCCIDTLRSSEEARNVSLEGVDVPAPPPADMTDWDELARAMRDLSADHQAILRLRYFADFSYRELAEALNIPQGTVMSRLHLARTALAAKIATEKS